MTISGFLYFPLHCLLPDSWRPDLFFPLRCEGETPCVEGLLRDKIPLSTVINFATLATGGVCLSFSFWEVMKVIDGKSRPIQLRLNHTMHKAASPSHSLLWDLGWILQCILFNHLRRRCYERRGLYHSPPPLYVAEAVSPTRNSIQREPKLNQHGRTLQRGTIQSRTSTSHRRNSFDTLSTGLSLSGRPRQPFENIFGNEIGASRSSYKELCNSFVCLGLSTIYLSGDS